MLSLYSPSEIQQKLDDLGAENARQAAEIELLVKGLSEAFWWIVCRFHLTTPFNVESRSVSVDWKNFDATCKMCDLSRTIYVLLQE
jgi:hypothetical protein